MRCVLGAHRQIRNLLYARGSVAGQSVVRSSLSAAVATAANAIAATRVGQQLACNSDVLPTLAISGPKLAGALIWFGSAPTDSGIGSA